ncbi:hypothetical protein ACTXT7_000805 [Hymenolepis weldensis]
MVTFIIKPPPISIVPWFRCAAGTKAITGWAVIVRERLNSALITIVRSYYCETSEVFLIIFAAVPRIWDTGVVNILAATGPLANVLSNQFDYRPVAMASALLSGIILVSSAYIKNIETFSIFFGVCGVFTCNHQREVGYKTGDADVCFTHSRYIRLPFPLPVLACMLLLLHVLYLSRRSTIVFNKSCFTRDSIFWLSAIYSAVTTFIDDHVNHSLMHKILAASHFLYRYVLEMTVPFRSGQQHVLNLLP